MLNSVATADFAREEDEPEEGRTREGEVGLPNVGAEKSMVAKLSLSLTGVPQREQKRAASRISDPQDEQKGMTDSRNSLSRRNDYVYGVALK